MRQRIVAEHQTDEAGNPTGGVTHILSDSGAVLCAIYWQNGPLGRGDDRQDANGVFVEGLLQAAIDRIQFFNTAADGKFRCRQNSLAITHAEESLHWLEDRTREREERQVEGTHTA